MSDPSKPPPDPLRDAADHDASEASDATGVEADYRLADPRARHQAEAAAELRRTAEEGQEQITRARNATESGTRQARLRVQSQRRRRMEQSLTFSGAVASYSLLYPLTLPLVLFWVVVPLIMFTNYGWHIAVALVAGPALWIVAARLRAPAAARKERLWLKNLPFTAECADYLESAQEAAGLRLILRWQDAPPEPSLLPGLLAAKGIDVTLDSDPEGSVTLSIPADRIAVLTATGLPRPTNYRAYQFFKTLTQQVLLELHRGFPLHSVRFETGDVAPSAPSE
ncbi:MAG TPA: hypothetical protein PKA88_24825 [Polyangiaceae bacterium]|nr:hypothetical protein [Polyangiaceae bacterium]HMR78777.1 hypothetical protein [Polyangiaceae bacterium]